MIAQEVYPYDSDLELSETNHDAGALKGLNRSLQNCLRDKDEMLGFVAHELKNPLGNLHIQARRLSEKAASLSPQDISEFASDIQESANSMLMLIHALLESQALEHGRIRVDMHKTDVLLLLRVLIDTYRERAARKGIHIHLRTDGERFTACTDRYALVRVLENLLSNAIKYSPRGSNVFVHIETLILRDARTGSQRSLMRISVRDEGPGINEADRKHLFLKFARLSAHPTGGESSTGLGLAIVKKFVKLIHGRVWYASASGRGAVFTVEIPVEHHCGSSFSRRKRPSIASGEKFISLR